MASQFSMSTINRRAGWMHQNDIFQYRGAIRQVVSNSYTGWKDGKTFNWGTIEAITLSGQGKGKTIKVDGYTKVEQHYYIRRTITGNHYSY